MPLVCQERLSTFGSIPHLILIDRGDAKIFDLMVMCMCDVAAVGGFVGGQGKRRLSVAARIFLHLHVEGNLKLTRLRTLLTRGNNLHVAGIRGRRSETCRMDNNILHCVALFWLEGWRSRCMKWQHTRITVEYAIVYHFLIAPNCYTYSMDSSFSQFDIQHIFCSFFT